MILCSFFALCSELMLDWFWHHYSEFDMMVHKIFVYENAHDTAWWAGDDGGVDDEYVDVDLIKSHPIWMFIQFAINILLNCWGKVNTINLFIAGSCWRYVENPLNPMCNIISFSIPIFLLPILLSLKERMLHCWTMC